MKQGSWLRADVVLVGIALVAAGIVTWFIVREHRRAEEAERLAELVARTAPELGIDGHLRSGELDRAELLQLLRHERASTDGSSQIFVAIRRDLRRRCAAIDVDIDRVLEEADLTELYPDDHLRRAVGAGCGEVDLPDGSTWISPARSAGTPTPVARDAP
jgi:hypothetical protein